jgi:two-component system phosphate regulon response regulator OmpR
MVEPQARILVADDEADLRGLLQRYLADQRFDVCVVEDAPSLDKLLARERFDVLVLDVMMPGEDGLAVCRRLRSQGENIPIIMLTARGDPVDRIVGLEMGADDYLSKPFNPRELLARIQSQLRRQRMLGARGADALADAPVRFGAFTLHPAARRLERSGQDVPLTTGEYTLLQALAMNPNRPMARDRLIELARGREREHEVTDRSIDVQVMRLRRLIEADPAQPRHIRTVWGVGYVFLPEGSAPAVA